MMTAYGDDANTINMVLFERMREFGTMMAIGANHRSVFWMIFAEAILLGLIFWGFLWGIPGMFLAAPLMSLLRVNASSFNISRPLERLLAA